MSESPAHFFLAVSLPSHMREVLRQRADLLKNRVDYKQWPDPQDYHITLAFLGAVEPGKISELKPVVLKAASQCAPFSISLNEWGTFGKQDQPRVLWAGVSAEQGLYDLQKMVCDACRSVGFELDTRPYRPHITLAKKWKGNGKLDKSALGTEIESASWQVKDIVLYQTHLRGTPKYEPVKFFPLRTDKRK